MEVKPTMKKCSSKWVATVSMLLAVVLTLNAAGLCSVKAQNQLSVSVQISNDNGYTVVTGIVTDLANNPVEGAAVSIQAVDASDKAVHFELTYTDKNGAFIDRFKTPEGDSGDGNIYVSASKPGYDNGNAQTAFTPVPEFPAALAIITSMSLAVLLLRRRSG
jgi:hypothetical protein